MNDTQQNETDGLTPAQARLIELDLKKPEIKAYYEELETVIAEVAAEIGVNAYFEAPDGTVFKIVKSTGTFVSFKDLDFERTKRADEKRGTLSVKEAQDAKRNGYKPLPEEE